MPRKKFETQPANELSESYAIRIKEWKAGYSFHSYFDKSWGDHFLSDLTIEIVGEAFSPSKIIGKKIRVYIHASPEITSPDKTDQKSLDFGLISGHGPQCKFTFYLPFQSLPVIIQILHANKCQGLIVGGTQLRYGQGIVHSINFVDEEAFQERY